MLTYLYRLLVGFVPLCVHYIKTIASRKVKKEPNYTLVEVQNSIETYLQIVRDFSRGYTFTSLPWEFHSRTNFNYHNIKLRQFLLETRISKSETSQSVIDQAVLDLTSSVETVKAGRDQLLFAALSLDNENDYHRKFR